MSDRLDRRQAVARLLAQRGGCLVVTGLGAPTYDVAAAGDDDRNFYLWGAMGGAAMVGLGLALAQPEKSIVVVTGDGEMLMGLGAFATIGAQQPQNLTIVVLDNRAYGETGGQPSHTALGADLAAIARGSGVAEAMHVTTLAEIDALAATLAAPAGNPRVIVVAIDAADQPRVIPERDGAVLKTRLRAALGLPAM
ncbi:MAG: aldehyde dehydrogenase [Hyphomicrobiales bacterium]|nr:aldehyde dehydrogenase [Hyphomicrobiales bacterium]